MLDEDEYSAVHSLFRDGFRASGKSMSERFQPACDEYERITGFRETNANAIMHHRISLYGPPCAACGKPLRTPRARFCAACGTAALPDTP